MSYPAPNTGDPELDQGRRVWARVHLHDLGTYP